MPYTLVFAAFVRVALEQGQVLEGGGVEDDLRPVLREYLLERVAVPDVDEHEVVDVEQAAAVDRELDGVQRRLVAVEQSAARPARSDAPAGTARSRSTRRHR